MEAYINSGVSIIDDMIRSVTDRYSEIPYSVCICSEDKEPSPGHTHIIIIYENDSYPSSEKHLALSEEYGDSYACMKLPLSMPELVSVLSRMIAAGEKCASSAPFRYNRSNATVYGNGKSVSLSPREAELFDLLLTSRGTPISREALRELLWQNTVATNVPDVYISYLRRKLTVVMGDGAIVNVRGKGYMLKNK